MSMYSHRLQIRLDDGQYERIAAAARQRGVSVATVVREAIDCGLTAGGDSRKAAARRLLEAPDMPVTGPAALKEELEAMHSRSA